MEILDTDVKYDLNHNIYLNTSNEKIKLTPDEAMNIVYAIVDSFGLSYGMLDDLQEAYDEYKEKNDKYERKDI